MATNSYSDLAAKVRAAVAAGEKAAAECNGDGGSANLDHVVLTDLKGVRETTLQRAGINGFKHRGNFHTSYAFGGQGERRYQGVQAMYRSLKNAGVPCYVYYQMD